MIDCDVLVIGGGPAGCFAAIKAKQHGAENVLLVDKAYVGKSGCGTFAAGSFKGFVPHEDSFELWLEKAVEMGCFINDQEWTQIHLNEVYDRVREMEEWGVLFEKNEDGSYKRIEGQGSSSLRPIKTLMFPGPELMHQLRKAVLKSGVRIFDRTMITSLIPAKDDKYKICGACGFELESGEFIVVKAKAVVLSVGGQSFKSHYAFHKMVTGDGHVMGLNAGAELTNYEFTLHHLSYAGFDTTGMNVIQGLRAIFKNGLGESFLYNYDPEHGDRGNLNTISAAMAMEVKAGRGPIYLDFSGYTAEDLALFKKVLPVQYKAFERAGIIGKHGIDEKLEWVSVNSGNVGLGGGLLIDTECRTSLAGLYAAGDNTNVPSAGVEGFCAYAIPFATTSGARAGTYAAKYARDCNAPSIDELEVQSLKEKLYAPMALHTGIEPDHLVLAVQETLFPMHLYILRNKENLEKALVRINWIKDNELPLLKAYDYHYLRMAIEAKNMVLCAELFLRAALFREESRGSHFRADFPETNNEQWLKWIILKIDDNRKLCLSTKDIPIKQYPLKPKNAREAHPIAGFYKD